MPLGCLVHKSTLPVFYDCAPMGCLVGKSAQPPLCDWFVCLVFIEYYGSLNRVVCLFDYVWAIGGYPMGFLFDDLHVIGIFLICLLKYR